jgi:hypothetical protein
MNVIKKELLMEPKEKEEAMYQVEIGLHVQN